jgi:predicted metal-dependent phosphoesterase TrpH
MHTNSRFDAVEVINSSAIPFNYSVRHGEQLASHLGISRVGGSDAHYGPEIGSAYTIVDAEPKVEDITEAIRKGLCRPSGGPIPLTTRLKAELLLLGRKISK